MSLAQHVLDSGWTTRLGSLVFVAQSMSMAAFEHFQLYFATNDVFRLRMFFSVRCFFLKAHVIGRVLPVYLPASNASKTKFLFAGACIR